MRSGSQIIAPDDQFIILDLAENKAICALWNFYNLTSSLIDSGMHTRFCLLRH